MVKEYKPPVPIPGHVFCLDQETFIYIFDKGLKKERIKNLSNEFRVVSYNFNKKKKEVKQAFKQYTGEKDCYEIELENGKKVIATSNHKFFNKNNKEVKVSDLKEGHYLLAFNSISGNVGASKKDNTYNKKMGFKKKNLPWHKGYTKKEFPQLSRKGNPNYGHPISEKARKKLSKMRKGKPRYDIRGENNFSFGKVFYPPVEYVEDLGHIIRSSWEKKVCRIFKRAGIKYLYEPKNFNLKVDNKKVTYCPDLFLPDYNLYIEIKGPLYNFQFKKMKEFSRKENLLVIGADRYKQIKKLKNYGYEKFIELKGRQEINELLQN